MGASDKVRGHCPRCGPHRWADVLASHKEHWEEPPLAVWEDVEHRILKCRGCETVYVQKHLSGSAYYFSQEDPYTGEEQHVEIPMITHWPTPTRRARPDWMLDNFAGISAISDPDLRRLLDEVYAALDTDLRVLAAIGIRTSFDRASELLGIEPDLSFQAKLRALEGSGHIGANEKEILDALTDAGSAAAHRGWRPSTEELNTMMEIIESFLHRSFVLGHEARKLKRTVPRRLPKPNPDL